MEKEYKGTTGILILKDTGIVIRRSRKNMFSMGGVIHGDKSIPYSSITAVQYKKPGFTAGYIQFTLMGGSEIKGGVLQAVKDENTVMFGKKGGMEEAFAEAKEIIEGKIHQSKSGVASAADELEKYAALKAKGIITEEEFEAKKKQLLGS